MELTQKVAVVTGASQGIGKAIAVGLARMNHKTILMGRSQKDLVLLSEEITDKGGIEPTLFLLDITDTERAKAAIKSIVRKFGRIDVLVNNAGIYLDGSLELSEEEFRKMLDTNLTAQFVFLKEVVPVMKVQKSGYIFNVASRSGKVGFSGSGGYSASKFGLVGLNESLYRELVPQGIGVTALCPGWVNTRMAFEAGTPLPADQMIQPEDIFRTIQWLLSLSPGACVKEVVLETPFNIS